MTLKNGRKPQKKFWTPLLFLILIFVPYCVALAQTPNGVVSLYVASTGNDTGNNCQNAANPCQTISRAVGQWASNSWKSAQVQVNLTDRGPFSGLYLTNTFTGNGGYNNNSGAPPNNSNSLAIIGPTSGGPAIITEAVASQGDLLSKGVFICASGAQLSISNVQIEIPDGEFGVQSLLGCQVYLSGTITFTNASPVNAGAGAALYQQTDSVITIDGSTKLTFAGLYKTVINGEGTGFVEFASPSSGTNSVTCAPGTQISGEFVDVELLSAVNFEPGWNWDNPHSGCGPSAQRVSAYTDSPGYQVGLASGAVVNNASGFNLPGPCASACVKLQPGTTLSPLGTPTVGSGTCANGAFASGYANPTNYAGAVIFTGSPTGSSCQIVFGLAGGTTGMYGTPAFATAPVCVASTSSTNNIAVTNLTTVSVTFTKSVNWSTNEILYYVCSASSEG